MTNIEKFLQQVKQRKFDTYETLLLLMRTNQSRWFSWGVTKIFHLKDNGIAFWVNGNHHVGYVAVVLGWNDTYTYYLVSQTGNPLKRVDEVYFDELQERIDKDVEFVDDYKF